MLRYSLPQIQSLQASLQPLAKRFQELAAERGVPVSIVQGLRTIAEQDTLYGSARKVTNAPGGLSYHNYGLAFDAVPDEYKSLPNWNPGGDKWKILGSIGESLGLSWGGRWSTPDLPHFELNTVGVRDLKAYWDKFRTIMPVDLSPSMSGLAMIAVIGLAWWFYLGPMMHKRGLL